MKHSASALLAIAILASTALGCGRAIERHDQAWSALVDAQRHYLEMGGWRMQYVDLGAGDPVMMIHGIGDSTYSWHNNAQALAGAGMRVILVDQPGFGLSDIPPQGWVYSVENQGEAILRVADSLKLTRFKLVGHSLGGGVSLYLAWKHPERVERVAVLSPASQRTTCPFGRASDLVMSIAGTRPFIARAIRSTYYEPDALSDVAIDEYARLLDRPGRAGRGVLGGVCDGYFSPTYDRMTESYSTIAPTLLILWGAQDTWHPLDFGKRLHELVPSSRLEIVAGAGHNVHQEKSEAVNAVLRDFLTAR